MLSLWLHKAIETYGNEMFLKLLLNLVSDIIIRNFMDTYTIITLIKRVDIYIYKGYKHFCRKNVKLMEQVVMSII